MSLIYAQVWEMLKYFLKRPLLNFFRPMEVPEDRGSKEIRDEAREPDFVLGESLAFPIEDILFSNKVECYFI